MPNSSTIPAVGSTQATPQLYNNVVKDAIRIVQVAGSDKSISSGAITVSPASGEGHYKVDTEASAAYDDLDTINGGADGDVITLQGVNAGRIVRVRHAAGNIQTPNGQHTALDTVGELTLRYNGTYWLVVSSSSEAVMTNKSGAGVNAGDIVVFDDANDLSFKTSTIPSDLRVAGIAAQAIPNNGAGIVYLRPGTIVSVNCTSAAVARGQFLASSTTVGKAKGVGYFFESGAFAVALSAKAGGSEGQVYAMLVQNFNQVVTGSNGYALGGDTGSASAVVQKMNMTVAAWSTVGTANLPTPNYQSAGLTYSTYGAFAIGGLSVSVVATAFYMPFASETTSLVSTANITSVRQHLSPSGSGATKGYVAGGSVSTTVDMCTYATMTTIASTPLTSARSYQTQLSDGTNSYVRGGTAATCDKIVIATGAVSANGAGALPAAVNTYSSTSFAASAGYNANDAACNKIVYATGAQATVASFPSGASSMSMSATDGLTTAYIAGSATAPRSQGYKLDAPTETFSTSAQLVVGLTDGAQGSNGTFS
jgi:hypothetical protein